MHFCFSLQKKRKYTRTNKCEPPNLHKRLSALSSEQLTSIIETLVGHHPELEEVKVWVHVFCNSDGNKQY